MRRWRILALSCLTVEALQVGCDGCAVSPNPASRQAPVGVPPQEASGVEKTASDAERDAAQQRAAFLSWALVRGLASPQKEANAPLYSVCAMGLIDTRFECKEGEPPPENGLCSASYRDATGWGACMTWKHGHPNASRIEFHTHAPIPLTCEGIGATALGKPWETSDTPAGKTDWFNRICQTGGYLVEVLQFKAGYDGEIAKTVLWLTSEEYLKFDEGVARLHKRNLKSAGVAE